MSEGEDLRGSGSQRLRQGALDQQCKTKRHSEKLLCFLRCLPSINPMSLFPSVIISLRSEPVLINKLHCQPLSAPSLMKVMYVMGAPGEG